MRESENVNETDEEKNKRMNKANWAGIGSTVGGERFQIGLRGTKGCEYGGCANCCLFEGASDADITPDNLMNQFEAALQEYSLADVVEGPDGKPQWADDARNKVKKIDFNGSGSFLYDKEMPAEARTRIFERLSQMPFETILIESRVEYITEEEIERLQSILRPDQKLEVAIGLESANNIVREVSVIKGYSLDDFRSSVETLAKRGVDVLVYSIVKPALLTETEAIADSVNTGRYLADLVDQVRQIPGNEDFQITMKLEQAFIQKGGYLDFLHRQNAKEMAAGRPPLYETPWSLSIAEIVDKLAAEGIADKINLQIGRSDDFPPPEEFTKNRNPDGTQNDVTTKLIDDALQVFNTDHDIEKLRTAVSTVQAEHGVVYKAWQAKKAA